MERKRSKNMMIFWRTGIKIMRNINYLTSTKYGTEFQKHQGIDKKEMQREIIDQVHVLVKRPFLRTNSVVTMTKLALKLFTTAVLITRSVVETKQCNLPASLTQKSPHGHVLQLRMFVNILNIAEFKAFG
jgi:hypothetical protein